MWPTGIHTLANTSTKTTLWLSLKVAMLFYMHLASRDCWPVMDKSSGADWAFWLTLRIEPIKHDHTTSISIANLTLLLLRFRQITQHFHIFFLFFFYIKLTSNFPVPFTICMLEPSPKEKSIKDVILDLQTLV